MKCDRCDNPATVHEVMIKGGKKVERHLCEVCAKAEGVPGHGHVPIGQVLTQYLTPQGGGTGAAANQPTGAGVPPDSRQQIAACGGCGMTFAQFRQAGLMGCPSCYPAFEGQLGPLLARAHEGGTHHIGKSPSRAVVGASPSQPPPQPLSPPEPKRSVQAAPKRQPGPPSAPPQVIAAAQPAEAHKPKPATKASATDPVLLQRLAMLRKQLDEAIAGEQYERAAKLRDELQRLGGGGAGVGGKPA